MRAATGLAAVSSFFLFICSRSLKKSPTLLKSGPVVVVVEVEVVELSLVVSVLLLA